MEIEPLTSPSLEAFHAANQQAWEEARKGELLSEEEVKIRMAEFKRVWTGSRLVKTK